MTDLRLSDWSQRYAHRWRGFWEPTSGELQVRYPNAVSAEGRPASGWSYGGLDPEELLRGLVREFEYDPNTAWEIGWQGLGPLNPTSSEPLQVVASSADIDHWRALLRDAGWRLEAEEFTTIYGQRGTKLVWYCDASHD